MVLTGQLPRQPADEETEGAAVGVRLCERTVETAPRAYGKLNTDAGGDTVIGDRTSLASKPPPLPCKVERVDPRLVEIDTADPALKLRKHELSIMLPELKAAGRVSEEGDAFYFCILCADIMAQDIADISCANFDSTLCKSFPLYVFRFEYILVVVELAQG